MDTGAFMTGYLALPLLALIAIAALDGSACASEAAPGSEPAPAGAKPAPRPMALGKPGPVAKPRLDAIKAELAKRLEADQGVRTGKIKDRAMPAVDAGNTAWLRGVIAEVGWIDCARFGGEAANAAFLIVQHSGDVPLMMAALPEIERDVKAKLVDAQPYTLLYDRLELRLGRKQRYGTQIGMEGGKLVVLPLQDRARVEEFRKEVGLFPLAAYLEMIRKQYGDQPVVFADDAKP
jgi:hypothetical protein